ncbi:MAG: DUF4912 domain-containing protein [Treponema sp.]|jgi:hypothetical protein|nr:DUF4912 domain-containing protein [Treponema sp.]
MDHIRLVRPYLDSLTTQELGRIADNCGIDIPPNLERIFIIEELLDYARAEEDDPEGEEEGLVEFPDCLETAPIPRQYNITFIDVMVRDPLWAFVFWEIKEHDREIFERDPEFSGYFLQIHALGRDNGILKDQSFTVQVDSRDTARYLGFSDYPPEGRQGEGFFRIDLYASFGVRSEVLAVSRVFHLPKLPEQVTLTPEGTESPVSSLALLSGSNEFRILRNTDRQSYRRFSCGGS